MYFISIILRILMITLGLWLAVVRPMAAWQGRDFPDESEINYSEGTLKVERQRTGKASTAYFIVVTPKNSLRGVNYYCSYAAYHELATAWCLRKEELEPYLNQQVRVGWYQQKSFLWFDNSHPQLVSLSVNGKIIRSYDDTLNLIKKNNDRARIGNIVIFIILFFGFLICDLSLAKTGREVLEMQKNKSNPMQN